MALCFPELNCIHSIKTFRSIHDQELDAHDIILQPGNDESSKSSSALEPAAVAAIILGICVEVPFNCCHHRARSMFERYFIFFISCSYSDGHFYGGDRNFHLRAEVQEGFPRKPSHCSVRRNELRTFLCPT